MAEPWNGRDELVPNQINKKGGAWEERRGGDLGGLRNKEPS